MHEGRSVASPAAALRPSAEWKGLRPGRFYGTAEAVPLRGLGGWEGGGWMGIRKPTRDGETVMNGVPAVYPNVAARIHGWNMLPRPIRLLY